MRTVQMPKCEDAKLKWMAWMVGVEMPYMKAMKHVRKRDLAVDLGAHAGEMTVKMVGDFARVLAFEPIPANVECIRKNAPAAEVVTAAVGAEAGMMRFAMSAASMLMKDGEGLPFVPVGEPAEFPVVQLDDYVSECDLLKLDVEKMELEALAGAENVLKSRPVIIIELKYNGPEIRAFLKERGYVEKWSNRLDGVFVSEPA